MLVVVLNDGETYTYAAGCKLVEFHEDVDPVDYEAMLRKIDQGATLGSAKVIATFH